jgi:Fuc2NAc and GlcNAc transferase
LSGTGPFGLGLLGGAAAVATAIGVALVRRWAARHHVVDVPNERSSHTRPTPRGGGLAIVVVVLVGSVVYAIEGVLGVTRPLLLCGLGALLVAVVSWREDLRGVPVGWRFAAHAFAAALALIGLCGMEGVDGLSDQPLCLSYLFAPLLLVWIVGLTNAFNFMDGVDGIAGSQGVVAGLAWFAFGMRLGNPAVAVVGVLISGSCLGFLFHNWPPARVFMGDVGSAFLGFAFAVLPVYGGRLDRRLLLAGALAVWPFVFDTAFTLARRLLRHENVFRSHRSHLYQRLVIAGWTHRAVTLLYAVLAGAAACAAALWVMRVAGAGLAAAVVPLAGAGLLLRFVSRAEQRVVEAARPVRA